MKLFTDLLGVDEETREFIFEIYLPVLDQNIGHIQLSLLENAELSENTLGTVIKLLYAFVWQESIVDLGGKKSKVNLTLNYFGLLRPQSYTRS